MKDLFAQGFLNEERIEAFVHRIVETTSCTSAAREPFSQFLSQEGGDVVKWTLRVRMQR